MTPERQLASVSRPLAFLTLAGVAMGADGIPIGFRGLSLACALILGIWISMIWPVDMLALLAVSIPVQDAGAFEVSVASITLTKLCLFCLAIGWMSRVVAGGRVPIDAIAWAYVLVGTVLGISIVSSSSIAEWSGELYRWLAATFVFITARSEIRERCHFNRLVVGVAVGVIGISLHAMRQVVTSDGPPSFVVNGMLRAYGTFGQPNPLAAYLEMSLPILIAISVVPLVNRRRPSLHSFPLAVSILAVAGGIVTMVLTQSRGGWLGFGAAGVVLLLGFPARARAGVVGGVAVSIAVGLVSGPGLVLAERLLSTFGSGASRVNVTPENWSSQERRAHWGAALNMVRAFPWTGVGAGGFDDAYREYTSDWRFRVSRGHAHNGYLQMAAQAGWGGLVAFFCWIAVIARNAVSAWRAQDRNRSDGRALGGLATIVSFGVHSMVDYLNVLSIGIQLALVLAIALADLPSGANALTEGTDTR